MNSMGMIAGGREISRGWSNLHEGQGVERVRYAAISLALAAFST